MEIFMDKNILLSKTFWLGVVTAIVPLFPSAQAFVVENIATIGAVLGFLMAFLRTKTSVPVSILPK